MYKESLDFEDLPSFEGCNVIASKVIAWKCRHKN
jgi:hypothetical protein